jgi:trehalose 6-phosphate phosphatase
MNTAERFLRGVACAGRVAVLSDFDGTLVPFRKRPEDVRLPRTARLLLSRLASDPRVSLGIVSGRPLKDLIRRVGVLPAWYVGLHGMEGADPDGSVRSMAETEASRKLRSLLPAFHRALSGLSGIRIEPKGLSVALHHRGVLQRTAVEARRRFRSLLKPLRRQLRFLPGNCVLEALPRGAPDKGTAVLRLLRRLPGGMPVVYAGDDRTDHEAFRALAGIGLRISVGVPTRIADLHLPGPSEWLGWLARLQDRLGPPA